MKKNKLRVWRSKNCKTPLLVNPNAIDEEYERAPMRTSRWDDEECPNGIYVIEVFGPLDHHGDYWFQSYDSLVERACKALDREDVRAVVLKIDSPGGVAAGMSATSRLIRKHAKRRAKSLYAYASEQMCSAAYGIACAASEIWGPPTAEIGSIGVILPVTDCSEAYKKNGVKVDLIVTGDRKGDGHPGKPFDKSARAALQTRVDALGSDFFSLVAKSRKMSVDAVKALQAGVFVGQAAVDAGLADGICTWQEFYDLVVSETVAVDENVLQTGNSGRAELRDRKVLTMAAKSKLAIARATKKAEAAIEAALKIKDPKKRAAAVSAATSQLIAAAKSTYKKTTKVEKTTEDEESDDDTDAEDEDAEDEEPDDDSDASDEDSDDSDASDEDSDDDSDEDEDEDEDEDKKKKSKSARLASAVRALTKSSNLDVQLGRLDAIALKAKRHDKLAKSVATLSESNKTAKIDSLIKSAIESNKVSAANTSQIEKLRTRGAKSPARLEAYVADMPVLPPRTIKQGAINGAAEGAPVVRPKLEDFEPGARSVIEQHMAHTKCNLETAIDQYLAVLNSQINSKSIDRKVQ